MKTNQKKQIYEKRAELKAMSKPLRTLVNEGSIRTINEGLRNVYRQSGHTVLNTIHEWNNQGKQVKKGEKALLLWARLRHVERVNEETKEMDIFDYWPICHVFSDAQVTDRRAE
jgi:hypothetical protein